MPERLDRADYTPDIAGDRAKRCANCGTTDFGGPLGGRASCCADGMRRWVAAGAAYTDKTGFGNFALGGFTAIDRNLDERRV